jgi:hypothetical protein
MIVARLRQLLQSALSMRPSKSSRRLGLEALEGRLAPATDVWTGLGADAHWSTAANWSLHKAPAAGDDLVFPSGVPAGRLATTNDLAAGTQFNSITLSGTGYTLAGNQITLGSSAPAPAAGNLVATDKATTDAIDLDIHLGIPTGTEVFSVAGGSTLTLGGSITPSMSGTTFSKTGLGTLVFGGTTASVSTGTTPIVAGTLQFNTPAGTGKVTVQQGIATIDGGSGADTFTATVGSNFLVSLDGFAFALSPQNVTKVQYNGKGTDHATLISTGTGDSALLSPGSGKLVSPHHEVDVLGVPTINIKGTAAENAFLYDSPGSNVLVATPTYATFKGTGFANQVSGFGSVNVYSTKGTDTAYLYDSPGKDSFGANPTMSYMQGSGFKNIVFGFASVIGQSTHGGGDAAYLYDAPGKNTFVATPTTATLKGAGLSEQANGFASVVAYAAKKGNDTAYLYDSPGKDTFYGTPTYAYLQGSGFSNTASGFTKVFATSQGGGDAAYLYDSAGKDTFVATPTSAYFKGTGFYNQASGFATVTASSTAAGDVAYLYGSSGKDTFQGTPTFAFLQGTGFKNAAVGFASVTAYSEGGDDDAFLYDSAGNDVFTGTSTSASLTGTGYSNLAVGFANVTAYSTGGSDRAYLYGSGTSADTYLQGANFAQLFGSGFNLIAGSFGYVYVNPSAHR